MTSTRPRDGAVAVMAALALAASAAAPAPAATPAPSKPTFALTAADTVGPKLLRASPGDTVRRAVRVRNLTRRPVTVRLQAADIRNATNGNADYVTTKLAQAGRWLELDAPIVRLNPRATRDVSFTVRIPEGTQGASHYAGIVAVDAAEAASAAKPKQAKGASFNFSRINRQAVPLTIRLPGPLTRSLALRTAELEVKPSGAALVLPLLPGGNTLIKDAQVKLRVSRGERTILDHDSALGQLFPGAGGLEYRIPWEGQPTEGSYQLTGVIRPEGAEDVTIDQTVEFTSDKVAELKKEAPPGPALPGLPIWVWLALAVGATLLIGMSVAILKLRRRPVAQAA